MKLRRVTIYIVLTVLIVPLVLAVISILIAVQVASRIVISPQAISAAAHDAVLITLSDGNSAQKLGVILALGKCAPDAKPFIPALCAAMHDSDPAVRKAAAELIQQIDPMAIEPNSM